MQLIKSTEKTKNIYRNLASDLKSQEDLFGSYIEKSVDDLNYLLAKGLAINLGLSCQCNIYFFVVIGYSYERIQVPAEKIQIRHKVTNVLRAIIQTNEKLAVIYIHSGVSAMRKGSLSMMKHVYEDLEHHNRSRLCGIYVI